MLEAAIHGNALEALAAMLVRIDIGNVVAVREVFLVPVAEGSPARVSQFAGRRLRAEVVSDEQLDCPQLIFP